MQIAVVRSYLSRDMLTSGLSSNGAQARDLRFRVRGLSFFAP